jgi:serine/threonine protein kinase
MGAVVDPENLMIITELMPKGSVHSLIHDPTRGKDIKFAQRMKMAKDAALGMNWLHLSKPCFIHRDLKSANLLVDDNFCVKVSDFGISLAKNAGESSKFGSIGTPVCMAPELLSNLEYDESVDV